MALIVLPVIGILLRTRFVLLLRIPSVIITLIIIPLVPTRNILCSCFLFLGAVPGHFFQLPYPPLARFLLLCFFPQPLLFLLLLPLLFLLLFARPLFTQPLR